ncbi:glycosyltransferase [Clostridiaceae bacterium M8S5]|nr:glycosyltransferase [Clostridiaceae bacterium M8S5]
MKVLRVTPHYYFNSDYWPSEFDPIGGMQVQIKNISEWLANNGIFQDIVTMGFPGIENEIKINDNLYLHSTRSFTLPFKSKYTGTIMLDESWVFGTIKWLLKNKNKKDYNLIHIHGSGVIGPYIVALFLNKFFKNIPIITSIHCSRTFTYEPMNLVDKIIHPIVKKIEKKVITISKSIVLTSEKMSKKFKESFIEHEDKFVVISDCLAQHHLKHKKSICCDIIADKYSLPKDKKIILFVGRVAHEKGWDIFLKMANNLKKRDDLFFLVCGDGPQHEDLVEGVLKYGLENKFGITGFISHDEVACIMKNASVLVMPSRHEEFGGASIEAVAAEIPVVASSVGGLLNIFKNEYNGLLVESTNDKAFADAVERIIEDDILRMEIIKRATIDITSKYIPKKVYPHYLKLYEI